jgi:U3 small nucleolar ribonucleoprotein protein IMP4
LGPTVYFTLANVVLRHDLKTKLDKMAQEYPHLIFDGFTTTLGERITAILKHIFPVPKVDSKRVITFKADHDTIAFRHHTYMKEDHKTVALNELGPRFELKPFQVILGTIEQT